MNRLYRMLYFKEKYIFFCKATEKTPKIGRKILFPNRILLLPAHFGPKMRFFQLYSVPLRHASKAIHLSGMYRASIGDVSGMYRGCIGKTRPMTDV